MDIDNLYCSVFNILGLELRNNKVFDVDNNSFLLYKGGFLIYGPTAIIHKKDTVLDILHNYKLTEYLLQVLLAKELKENSLYVQSYGLEVTAAPLKQYYLCAVTNKGNFESAKYFNSNLAIIEFMYYIAGLDAYSLRSEYDYTMEEAIERLKK